MWIVLKWIFFLLIAVADLTGSVGIMKFGFSSLAESETSWSKETIDVLDWLVVVSVFFVMLLTRVPAAYSLCFPAESPTAEEPAADWGIKKIILGTLTCLSFIIFTPGFYVVQFLGNKSLVKHASSDVQVVDVFSNILAFGSVVGFLAFLFKGGVLRNVNNLLKGHGLFDNLCLFATNVILSGLGAVANALFAYYTLENGLEEFSLTKHMSEKSGQPLNFLYALSVLYMVIFSYVLDTNNLMQKGFGEFYKDDKVLKFKDLHLCRKFILAPLLFLVAINKLSRFFVFYLSALKIIKDWHLGKVFPNVLSFFAALSAIGIAVVFESVPERKVLMRPLDFFKPTRQHSTIGHELSGVFADGDTARKSLLERDDGRRL